MDEVELTELTDIEVVRQDAVKYPASGAPVLIMKAKGSAVAEFTQAEVEAATDTATGCGCCPNCTSGVTKAVNAVGGIDEKPDIAGAERILQELAKLIASEAAEMASGAFGETSDIQTLLEAASLMHWFRQCEMDGDDDDGAMMKAAGFVFKAHRKFSSDERKKLASEDKALPDGSYPIPDEDALRRAAILARSGHGDVAAAKKLIARRARELGVKNPLSDNAAQKDAREGVTPETSEGATAPAAENGVSKDVIDLIEKAKAEVRAEAEERNKALADELAVLKSTPIPGHVALSAPQGAANIAAKDDLLQKAARFRRGTESNDRETSQYYKAKLAEVEAELAKL